MFLHLQIVIVFLLVNAFGIDSFSQKRVGIKLYQNTDIFTIQERSDQGENMDVTTTNFNRLSLTLLIGKPNGFAHEIEIFIPEISKPIDRFLYPINYEIRVDEKFQIEGSSYSARYEFNRTFTNSSNKLGFNLGVGLNPYYVNIESFPQGANAYYSSREKYGAAFNLIPRVNYQLAKRFVIDVNIPLIIYDLRREVYTVENPQIPKDQKAMKSTENMFFENTYTIRLGLSYYLSK